MSTKRLNSNEGVTIEARNWACHGIQIGHAISRSDSYSSMKASSDNDLVRLHFGLRGDYRFNYKQLNRNFDLAGGHHNVMYSKGIDIEVYNKTLQIETLGVNFPREFFIQLSSEEDDLLQKFIDSILIGQQGLLSEQWGTITIHIQKVIDEILQHPYNGDLQKVFLMAKSLELLVLCVDNYRQNNNAPLRLKQPDKERLIAARDFVNDRLATPPNLTEIAQFVGLNEFKLKKGFKAMFQCSVFEYLTQRRLGLAMQSLKDTRQTAAEIAYELGYSSPQYFNNQFRKRFGVTPNSVRKNP